MEKCKTCSKKLSINELGLNYKLISRELKEFECIDCLGKTLKISKETLLGQIKYYIAQGCELFSKK